MARHESATGGRLWGIDVIAGIYWLATLMMFWLFFVGTKAGVIAAVILGPICAVLAIGIGTRVNWIRRVLMVLLIVGIAGSILLAFYLLGVMGGVWSARPNVEPVRDLIKQLRNVIFSAWMLLYLWRADVRAAFLAASQVDEMVSPAVEP